MKESRLPDDWFNIADKDLKRVRIMLGAGDIEDAQVHLQQTIEKYLKGYLLSKGWELQKTHNLVKLIDYAVEYEPSFEDFRELSEKATGYYMIDRYPFFIANEVSEDEIKKGIEKVEELKDKILRFIKGD